jgi:sialic acid synthase SpsE
MELIKAMAETGLHTVISTGMATAEQITAAYKQFTRYAPDYTQLTLLHCTSAYPAPDADMNLSRIQTLRNFYPGVKAGLSDHSRGTLAAALATAYNATWIEKHFTLDKKMKGPDHSFSADPLEMMLLVKAVRQAELMIGNPYLGMTETEKNNRKEWFKNG